ncbi:osteopontin [Colossoma macropomum]|uniref:osteopontin n=1 Tax=Colossoma macropomum TaxID=42526 RepID=UPI001864922B|nr:osteopontin [Colossoma macropomum]
MKAVIIFGLLFAVVYCHPVKRSASSSESSEEQAVAQPPLQVLDKGPANPPEAVPAQDLKAAAVAAVASDEDTDDSDEAEDKNTESDTEGDSADSADTQDTDTDDSSESAESGETEATTVPPVTVEPTLNPVIDNGRGDSMGYPSDYKKTIIYMDANDVEKIPSSYKSYGPDKTEDLNNISVKTSHFDGQEANDVEKHLKVYKALQVHNEVLEEDTSTPEEDEVPSAKQASLGSEGSAPAEEEIEGASASDASGESASASASQEQKEEANSSKSSEEATATPGTAGADNDSSQSSESQEDDSAEQAVEATTDVPDVIIAK